MLFNSLQFVAFFMVVYGVYLSLGHKWQNKMLLVASYIFYGMWDWRFLSLIMISTILDYVCGIKIHKSVNPEKRKLFLFLSLCGNLAILGFFKYFNFFIDNVQELLSVFGFTGDPFTLKIILPVGISFYTFQTMSYTIDIYRREMEPTRHFFDFALFVAFFPQLVAGPIERAKRFLPQILSPRVITRKMFHQGCYLICLGYFQKVFVADNLAAIVNPVFASEGSYNGMNVLLALYAFTFQIYCDFAGYSNIARGIAKIMGFDIMLNFDLPFFARNPQEFWKRWHISLTTWIRDYLYIPLFDFLKMINGELRIYVTLMIAMGLMGLWHGSSWTFVIFGLYHGLLLSVYTIMRAKFHIKSRIKPKNIIGQKLVLCLSVVFMYHLTVLGMLIFRAQSMTQVMQMLGSLVGNFQFTESFRLFEAIKMSVSLVWFLWFLALLEILQFKKKDLFFVLNMHWAPQGFIYFFFIFFLTTFSSGGAQEFIYFQF